MKETENYDDSIFDNRDKNIIEYYYSHDETLEIIEITMFIMNKLTYDLSEFDLNYQNSSSLDRLI